MNYTVKGGGGCFDYYQIKRVENALTRRSSQWFSGLYILQCTSEEGIFGGKNQIWYKYFKWV